MIEKENKKFYLLGKSLPHSLSKDIYRRLGLDYHLKELPDENAVKEFVLKKDYCGLNVTIPYKETVLRLLDRVEKSAQAIGAVNTVLNDNGRLLGFNTDTGGMAGAFSNAKINPEKKRVMILGSGGTSKTAQYFCVHRGATEIGVVSREGVLNYSNIKDFNPEIIINTTPVGMFPNLNAKPVCLSDFENVEAVFDAVYNPHNTRLILDAKALGIKCASGLFMLCEQARLAYELFTSKKTDEILAKEIYLNLLEKQCNIVLIGMAGAGKTKIGRRLSELLNRDFLDTDEIVEKKTNQKIPEIFANFGESVFRKSESAAIAEAALQKNAVIATGGGAVMNEENRCKLFANAIVVHIKRDLNQLDISSRPLSAKIGVNELWNQRREVYQSFCDFEIENNSTIDDAANAIVQKLKEII